MYAYVNEDQYRPSVSRYSRDCWDPVRCHPEELLEAIADPPSTLVSNALF